MKQIGGIMNRKIFKILISTTLIILQTSCSKSENDPIKPDIIKSTLESESANKVTETINNNAYDEEGVFEDNVWATFLVSPSVPAYKTQEQGYEILDVLCEDSIIGRVASLSRMSPAPEEAIAYDTTVITAGGPVDYNSLAYGKLSEVPDSFLNAMIEDMQLDIGDSYGGHSSGSGMGYRTFYQASYDADTGNLQVNQTNGYWARTLGAFSEHCAGVAVDFDVSYQNSEYLESTGAENKAGENAANKEFKWLANNAHKYGFIWRFKIDGSDESASGFQTGTIMEGWHWRFVGVYHATKFWEQCAIDTDENGQLDSGYMIRDDYIWANELFA